MRDQILKRTEANAVDAHSVDPVLSRFSISVTLHQTTDEYQVDLAGLCLALSIFMRGFEAMIPWTSDPKQDIAKCSACIDAIKLNNYTDSKYSEAQNALATWAVQMALPYMQRLSTAKDLRKGIDAGVALALSPAIQCLHFVGNHAEAKKLLSDALNTIPSGSAITFLPVNPLLKLNSQRAEQYQEITAQLATCAILIGEDSLARTALNKWVSWKGSIEIKNSLARPGMNYLVGSDLPFDPEKRKRFAVIYRDVTGKDSLWIEHIKSPNEIFTAESSQLARDVYQKFSAKDLKNIQTLLAQQKRHSEIFGLDAVMDNILLASKKITEVADSTDKRATLTEARKLLSESLTTYLRYRHDTSEYGYRAARRWEALQPHDVARHLGALSFELIKPCILPTDQIAEILSNMPTMQSIEECVSNSDYR